MALPGQIENSVSRSLEKAGMGTCIVQATPVSGGCINNGSRIQTNSGRILFLKWNPSGPPGMFEAEADGLRALRGANALRVPEPIDWYDHSSGKSWLLLEHVFKGSASQETDTRLGHGLAAIHSHGFDEGFGWHRDNWIGSLPQDNGAKRNWGHFWRDQRIGAQLEIARSQGRLGDAFFDRVLEITPNALEDVEQAGLLHGDLWGGNWFTSDSGEPALIDPAVYYGHGEVDLAMSELFGGFGPDFYDAYKEKRGISNAYSAYRRDLYQFYYLLVHVNLFGASYEARSTQAAQRILAELGG